MAARNYAGTNQCRGWLGLRFQHEPQAQPSEITLHVDSPKGSADQKIFVTPDGKHAILGQMSPFAGTAGVKPSEEAINAFVRAQVGVNPAITWSVAEVKPNAVDDLSEVQVILTTLHGAKGLEFPVCFMIGLEEELLPHARTLQPQATDVTDTDHAVDISEERRLCYVGITRAQRKLYLTRACTRVSRGRVIPRTPSRFLLEIPDELLEVRDLGEEARQKVPADEVRNFFANFAFDD